MDETNTKPIRRFLHLGKSVAPQVRERAARWGLGEMDAIHQLIRLGLRASSEEAKAGANDMDVNQVGRLAKEILNLQLEALLYQREMAADATLVSLVYERLTANDAAATSKGSSPKGSAPVEGAPVDTQDKGIEERRRAAALKNLDDKVRRLARPAFKQICDRAVDTDASRPQI
ncbi:hypothetical protein [Nevskia sp.]|uniref:hypothetical protein n=1 Tax=Nevskia sp. TaxID=1929292 RepID=UPI003F709ABA